MIDALLWLPAALLCALAVVRLAGLERGTPLVQLTAFTPYWAAGAVAVAVASAAGGYRGPALAAGVAAIALAGAVAGRTIPATLDPAPCGSRLRVLSANLLYRLGDAPSVLAHVKSDDVDLLAVQELTFEGVAGLDAAGVAGLLPYRVAYPTDSYTGSALFSRHPLTPGPLRRHACGNMQATATVSLPDGEAVLVESVHPCAPYPGRTACWERDLREQQPATTGGTPLVLLGDFNATLDHMALRRLLRTGYRDAAAERGKGLVPTWPFRRIPAPWVTLDHVLVDRRIGVLDFGTRGIRHSDHRAVYAELSVPAAAPSCMRS